MVQIKGTLVAFSFIRKRHLLPSVRWLIHQVLFSVETRARRATALSGRLPSPVAAAEMKTGGCCFPVVREINLI